MGLATRAAAVALVALVAVPATAASRRPTAAERSGIVRVVKPYWQLTPQRCLAFAPRVSTANSRFAYVPTPVRGRKACLRYRGNGFIILRRVSGDWIVVYQGSDPPVCDSPIPPKVTRDLTKLDCLKR